MDYFASDYYGFLCTQLFRHAQCGGTAEYLTHYVLADWMQEKAAERGCVFEHCEEIRQKLQQTKHAIPPGPKTRSKAILWATTVLCQLHHDRHPTKVLDNLFISSIGGAINKPTLDSLGITHVVSCIEPVFAIRLPGLQYLHVPITDTTQEDVLSRLDEATDWIENAVSKENGTVLVHCMAGQSRSATIVLAYCVRHGGMTLQDALEHLCTVRPKVCPNKGFIKQLRDYEMAISQVSTLTYDDMYRLYAQQYDDYSNFTDLAERVLVPFMSTWTLPATATAAGGGATGAGGSAPNRGPPSSPLNPARQLPCARVRIVDPTTNVIAPPASNVQALDTKEKGTVEKGMGVNSNGEAAAPAVSKSPAAPPARPPSIPPPASALTAAALPSVADSQLTTTQCNGNESSQAVACRPLVDTSTPVAVVGPTGVTTMAASFSSTMSDPFSDPG